MNLKRPNKSSNYKTIKTIANKLILSQFSVLLCKILQIKLLVVMVINVTLQLCILYFDLVLSKLFMT